MPDLKLSDLTPELRVKVRERTGRKRMPFTAEHERRWAIRVLAVIADLSQSERHRVLRRATGINNA